MVEDARATKGLEKADASTGESVVGGSYEQLVALAGEYGRKLFGAFSYFGFGGSTAT